MTVMKKWLLSIITLLASSSTLALTPWQEIQHPVSGVPQAIGQFANGCIIGAKPLPLVSPNYQLLRPDQRRYFGHPELITFIKHLTSQAHRQKLGTVLIGDLSMPAGGLFDSAHASHQSGLDVDIWLQLPHQRWTEQQLLAPKPIDVVSVDGKQVMDEYWQPQTGTLIKLAAKNSNVTRIFVNPAIKKRLCEDAGVDRNWLHKVRPWFGHRAHMHVRLRCPIGSAECLDQPLPPAGDGCGAELASWFVVRPPNANPIKKEPPPPPPACQTLIDEHLNQSLVAKQNRGK